MDTFRAHEFVMGCNATLLGGSCGCCASLYINLQANRCTFILVVCWRAAERRGLGSQHDGTLCGELRGEIVRHVRIGFCSRRIRCGDAILRSPTAGSVSIRASKDSQSPWTSRRCSIEIPSCDTAMSASNRRASSRPSASCSLEQRERAALGLPGFVSLRHSPGAPAASLVQIASLAT